MKRFAALTGVLALIMALGLAVAEGNGDELSPHGHVLLVGAVYQGVELVDFRKCVDLANARALRHNAHHDTVHVGSAGKALSTRAGHLAGPTFDFDGCVDLEAVSKK